MKKREKERGSETERVKRREKDRALSSFFFLIFLDVP